MTESAQLRRAAGSRRALCVLALVAVGCAAVGCTEFDDGSDTILAADGTLESAQSEQPSGPAEPGEDWSCLEGDARGARLLDSSGENISYLLRLVDVGSGADVENVVARGCALTDLTCDDPITDMLAPNGEGWIEVPLSENFAGYLEIISPDYVPYIFHLPEPGLRDMRDFPLFMVGLESYFTILEALRIQASPDLGAIGMRAFDCQGEPAPGVTLRSNAGGVEWYMTDGLPNRESRSTDADGLGGFVGVQPGVTILEATLDDGTPAAEKSIIVRPGWMTAGYLRPRAAIERLQDLGL